MVRIFFTTLGTCLSSSISFRVVSMFLEWETPQGWWDILFNPLKTIAKFHFFGSMGLIKSLAVGVGLGLFFAFSNGDSSNVCQFLFFQGCCHLICCNQNQLPSSGDSFRSVQPFEGICSAFAAVESFHCYAVFGLLPAVYLDKQVSISCFLYVFWCVGSSFSRNNLFYEERREFSQAYILQRFNDNESWEVSCLILRVRFG